MPLNDLQRYEIDNAIAHFFYDLPMTPEGLMELFSQLNEALSVLGKKLPEQKEEKEQKGEKIPPANPYSEFVAILLHTESKLKGLHKKNSQPILLREVQEYILFYCICRLKYHVSLTVGNDDFTLSDWLCSVGWKNAELEAPWNLQAWLTRLDAHDFMLALGWDSRTTWATLQTCANHLFDKPASTTEDDSFTEYWQLSPHNDRTYEASINERHEVITTQNGKRYYAKLDLDIRVHLSASETKTILKPNFEPYPQKPVLPAKTLQDIDHLLKISVFDTPDKRRQARNTLIESAESRLIDEARKRIKVSADKQAEEATTELLFDTYKPKPKPEKPAPSTTLNDDPANNRCTPEVKTPPASPHSGSSVLSRSVTPIPDMPSPVIAVSALALQPFARVLAEVTNPSLTYSSSDDSDEDIDPIMARELEEKIGQLPPTTIPVNTLPDKRPAGYQLLTYIHYFDAFKQGSLTLAELESYTAEDTTRLTAFGVRHLLQRKRLDKPTALTLKPSVLILLESPFYQHYFEQHPEAIRLAETLIEEQARCLSVSFITHLIANHHLTLETAFQYTLAELTMFRHPIYGNYFCLNPHRLGVIRGIQAETRDFLLHEAIVELFQKGKLALETALVLKERQPKHQLDLLLDPVSRELFLQDKLTWSRLCSLTPESCRNLRHEPTVKLVLENIITEDAAEHLTYAERERFAKPHIHQLLLARKVTPAQAKSFSVTLETVVEKTPYAAALAANPELITHLQTWDDASAQQLLTPAIRTLFAEQLISFTQLRLRSALFFPILTSDRIFTLLMEGKIRLSQALALTHKTLRVIHDDDEIYNRLQIATTNSGQLDFIPGTVWPLVLSRRLFAIYDNKPERLEPEQKPDTVAEIKAELDTTAIGEQLAVESLREMTIEQLLKRMRDDLKRVIKGIPANKVPGCLIVFIQTVDRRCRGENTLSWVNTLVALTQMANKALDTMPQAPPAIRYSKEDKPVTNLTQFHPPFHITPLGARRFCQHLVEFDTAMTVVAEQKPTPALISTS